MSKVLAALFEFYLCFWNKFDAKSNVSYFQGF
jgi:hypothetical protein